MSNTLAELLSKYHTSDSMSEREALKDEIIEKCQKYVEEKTRIASKYDIKAYPYTDYRIDRGWWTLDEYDILSETVTLIYEDRWAYGGSCSETFYFSAKEVDNFIPEVYDKSYKSDKTKSIKEKIASLKRQITIFEDKLNEIENLPSE
jgi:hypothetical protein